MARTASRGTRGHPSANQPTPRLTTPSKSTGHIANEIRETQSAEAIAQAPSSTA